MSAFYLHQKLAAPLEVNHWLRQSNRDEAATLVQTFGRLVAPSAVDEHASRLIGMLQREGLAVTSGNLRHSALLVNADNAMQGPNPALQVKLLRELASDHAQWNLQRSGTVSVGNGVRVTSQKAVPDGTQQTSTPGWFSERRYVSNIDRPDDGRHYVSPNPFNAATAPAESAWSDQRVANAVDKLAREQGFSAPALIELMKSIALDPSMTNAQRASSLNRSVGAVENWSNKLRGQLGAGDTHLRIALAERIGMPFSAVVARIRVDGDPGLTQRVLAKINPGYREGVARKLLTVQSGTDADINIYRALNTIFFDGNFLSARNALAEQLAISQGKADGVIQFLQRTFPSDRIEMLRAMGFTHEQMLSMNPVGAQLNKRLDPALGTYSTAERALRQSKRLPCTREEAAQRLLVAGVEKEGSHFPLSFRNLLALGLVSDRPWLTPNQLSNAFGDAVPGSNMSAGASDINRAFREAQALLGRDIPRGFRNDLMDSRYRADINLVLLQAFGLGATRAGSGVLQPIPTEFAVDSWPSPRTESAEPERPASSTSSGAREATWQELMPLLERHDVLR